MNASASSCTIGRLWPGGGLIVTYACSAACGHCLYRSSGRRDKAYIDRDTAARAFRTAHTLGCDSMHIGGGEPFLKPDALLQVLEAAQAEGVDIDYVETNCSWFKDESTTAELLEQVRRRGCGTLLVSMDPFHNGFVPFRKVKGVMAACRRAGMGVFPWQMEFYADVNRFDDTRTHSLADYQAEYGPDYLPGLLKRYHLTPGGRVFDTFRAYLPKRPPMDTLAHAPAACTNLADASHFHLDLYGNFVPPGCIGLAVAWADLGKPLASGRYPAYTCLHGKGLRELHALAATRGFTPARADGYVSHCELCAEIRGWLLAHEPQNWPDLAPAEFYRME
jgi:hypothetical protein